MAEKPSRGLADVVAASTALSDIDGRAGRLFYRGYDSYDRMSRKMEEIVFAEKGRYPNVDFYAATVYHCLRIPLDAR